MVGWYLDFVVVEVVVVDVVEVVVEDKDEDRTLKVEDGNLG